MKITNNDRLSWKIVEAMDDMKYVREVLDNGGCPLNVIRGIRDMLNEAVEVAAVLEAEKGWNGNG